MANQDFRVKNGLQVGLGASVVGVVTAESFSGSAVGLTSVPSASLTGTISSERLSGTYDIDILGTVSGDTINATTATISEQLNVGAGDTGVFATATDGTLLVTGIATFKDRVIFDSTNSIQVPVGTEAEKDAVGVAVTGQIRYNTTNSQFEGFGPGNDWGSLGGVKDVDGDTYVKPESSPGSDEDALTFFTGGTERAVIDSNGKVGIATTNPTSTLDLDGTLNVSGISTFQGNVGINTSAGNSYLNFPIGNNVATADIIHAGTGILDYTLYALKSSNQHYIRQYTSGYYNVSVGGTNAFVISNTDSFNSASDNPAGVENVDISFVVNPESSTELRYNYNKKFETTGYGVSVYGGLDVSGISTFQDRVIFDSTNSIQIPVGTSTERDEVGTAVTGQIRYNTTLSSFEGYGPGGEWGTLGGVKDIDQDTYITAQKDLSVDDDALRFYTNGTEQVSIDSTGKVGIGSTQPTSTLDVDGTLNVSGISTFQDSVAIGTEYTSGSISYINLPTGNVLSNSDIIRAGSSADYTLYALKSDDQHVIRQYTSGNYTVSVGNTNQFTISNDDGWGLTSVDPSGAQDHDVALIVRPDTSTELRYNYDKKFATTTDGFEVVNGTSETAVISGPQNIILDPSPDDVVSIVEGDISAAGVSTITGITTTNIAVGNLIQEVDGVISTGTTVTSVGASQVGISKTSLGSATNQEFTFVNQTPTGIVRIKGDLYIDGTRTEINSTTLTVDDLNVVVASGATNGLTADTAGLTVDGVNAYLKYNYNAGTNETWELNKNVGIGTDNATAKLDVVGFTELDNLNVSAASTFASDLDINASVDISTNLTVDGLTDLDELNVTGISTFSDDLIVGTATTGVVARTDGTLNVSGVSTFNDEVTISKSTTNPALSIKFGSSLKGRLTPQTSALRVSANATNDLHLQSNDAGGTTGDVVITSGGVSGNYTGSTGRMAVFTGSGSAELYYQDAKKLETTGYGVTVTGGLNVSGVSTFASDVDINADVNVSGIVTAQLFSGNGGSLTNVSAFEAYKSDISERAFKTDEISGSLVYAYDGQRFSNLGTGTGSLHPFAIKSVISKDGKVAFVSEYDTQNTSLNSGRIHIYERTGANFTAIGIVTQTSHSSPGAAQTTTCFGPIIACNDDGSIFAVGSPQGNYQGSGSGGDASNFSWWHNPAGPGQQSVHIFQKNGSTITNIGILTSPSLGSDSNGSDSFGGALAFSDDGSRLYVGSPRRDDASDGNGGIFVYDKSGTTYNYVGIITSPNGLTAFGGGTGQELACSSDGNILFSGWPGAYRPRSDGSGSSYSGVIEIYDRSGSNFTNIGIVSSGYYANTGNVLGQDFGNEIACSDDGTYLYSISREPGTGAEQYEHGKLHLFKRESNTYSEVSSDTLDSPVEVDNRLGWGLACSSDGSKVIAGECNFVSSGTTGYVHYYARVGDGIVRVGFATAGIAQGGSYQFATFGFSVDLSGSGEVGIVGSPYQEYVNTGENGSVFFLKETRGTTVYSDILTGNIGIKSDSPKATLDVNGTLNVSGVATAQLFSGNGGSLTNVDAVTAYSADLSTIATVADSVSGIITYLRTNDLSYADHTDPNNPPPSLDNFYGHDVAISGDGKVVFITSTPQGADYGSVHIYERTTSGYNYIGFVTETSHSVVGAALTVKHWGEFVATNGDGSIFAVGSPQSINGPGASNIYNTLYPLGSSSSNSDSGEQTVHIFQKNGSTIESLGIVTTGLYKGSSTTDGDYFGASLAFSKNGSRLYVGAPRRENFADFGTSHRGAVHVFDKSGSSYTHVGIITATGLVSTSSGDVGAVATDETIGFGAKIACSDDGNKIFVANPYGFTRTTQNGLRFRTGWVAAYDRSGSTFTQVGIITGVNGTDNYRESRFGHGLACSSDGQYVIIGAPNYDTSGLTDPAGRLQVYKRNGNSFENYGIYISPESLDGNVYGQIGYDIACNSDATRIITGEPEYGGSGSPIWGSIQTLARTGSTIVRTGVHTALRETAPTDSNGDFYEQSGFFGHSVDMDDSGSNLLVGALEHTIPGELAAYGGSAYIFEESRQIALHSSQATGYIGVGTDNPTSSLDINGTLNVSGVSTFLNDVNIGIGGTTAFFDVSSGKVGIGTTNAVSTLTVDGNISALGFVGDGSSLSNVIASSSYDSVNSDYATSVGDVYGYASIKKYLNEPTGGEKFYGQVVSVSGDGNILAVSERYGDSDSRSATNAGQVHILRRTGGSDAFSTVGVITAGPHYDTAPDITNAIGGFAMSLDLNYDGSSIIIGAPYHWNREYVGMSSMGLAYIYDRNKITNELTLVGILTAGSPDSSLDMETSTKSGVGTDANFGYSVGVNHDGTRYAVGAPKEYHNVYYDGSNGGSPGFAEFEFGAVHVFDRSGSTFTEVKRITNQIMGEANAPGDDFGHSIKMSNSGDLIYIGAPGAGAYNSTPQQYGIVCAYDISQTGIANTLGILTGGNNISELQDNFGSSVTCSHDGSIIIVGAPDDEPEGTSGDPASVNKGMAYVFEKDNSNNFNRIGIITNFNDIGGSSTDPDTIYESNNFGSAVACNSDASIIAISDSGAEYTQNFLLGAVGIYKRSGSTITRTDIVRINELGSPASYNVYSAQNKFGNSLSLSDSGRYLAIGAPKDNVLTSGGASSGHSARVTHGGTATISIQEFKSIITTDDLINRVGIGSTQPTATLDINGTLNVSGISTFQNNIRIGNNNAYWGNAGGGTGIAVFGINEDLEIGATGNRGQILNKVGELRIISDTEITLKDRAGNFYAKFTEDGSAELYHDGDIKFETTGYGANVSSGLNVSGIATIGNYLNIGGSDISIGSATINGDQAITFDGTAGNLFTITDNLTTGNLFAVNDVSGFSVFEVDVDGTIRMGLATNDNVGIGTTQPTAKLDVNGTLNVSGVSTFQDDVNIGTGSTVAFFDISAGRVGIGSTTPTAKLDVNGTLNVSGVSTFSDDLIVGTATTGVVARTDGTLNVSGVSTFGGNVDIDGRTDLHQTAQGSQAVRIYGSTFFTSDSSLSTVNPTPAIVVGSDYRLSGDYVPAINYVGVTTTKENLNIASPGDSITGINTDDLSVGMQVLPIGTGGQYIEPYTFIESIGISTVYLSKNHTATLAIGVDFSFKAVEPREDLGNQYEKFDTLYVNNVDANTVTLGNIQISSGIITATSGIVTYHGDGSQLSGIDATSLKDSNGVIRAQANTDGTISIGTHSIVSITTSHTASAGTPFTIDTFATSENDLAEYTMHVGYGTYIQAQKVLVMHDGSTAYSQEYAVMYNPSKLVTIEASISGSNVLLQATPETGVSGITTYKLVRGGLV